MRYHLDSESLVRERLLKLVRETKRYAICEDEPGILEVIDTRHILDQLLQMPELRPTSNDDDWIQIEFEEALDELSRGPTLTSGDKGMLAWLETTVEILDPEGENPVYNRVYAGARVMRGGWHEVGQYLRTVLQNPARFASSPAGNFLAG